MRYCEMCDRWVSDRQRECRACGAPTIPAAKKAEQISDSRFTELIAFTLGPRPEES